MTEDQTLTANNTLADIEGLGPFSYQWSRGGAALSGATNRTYLLGDDDADTTLTVTISYTDGLGTAESVTSAATRVVLNVNDAPSFLPGLDVTVPIDAGLQLISNWATTITAGPANEAGQNLSFIPMLSGFTGDLAFDTAPAISTNDGALSFAAMAGTSGTVNVSVVLMDDAGIDNAGVDTSDPENFLITIGTSTADLVIIKTNGSNSFEPGEIVTWQIVVDNPGAVDVTGVLVQDPVPARIINPQWSCAPLGAMSSCASGGASISGDVTDLLNLQAGVRQGVIITLTGTLDMDETGSLSNTATLTLPATVSDPDMNNNTSTDTDAIGLFADGFEDIN